MSVSRRKYSLERNDKIKSQEGRHILVRLASARVSNGAHAHRCWRTELSVKIASAPGEHIVLRIRRGRQRARGVQRVRVRRHFRLSDRVRLLTGALTQIVAAADVNRRAPAEVRERERGHPVSSVRGPKDRKERLVQTDRQQLPVTESVALGREAETDDLDFPEEWLCHVVRWFSPLSAY